ncbi:MAG TPA: response regulator, partial [Bacteroidia bacterium]|nr:response regulator [Bacteroidia bacterium]
MSYKKINLLVVDDDEVDRIAIKRAIKSSGFNADLHFGDTYDEGMEKALSMEFDVLIVDYYLTVMNAGDFISEYFQRGGTAPIIVVSSQGEEKIVVELMKAGACDYIPKAVLTPETIARSLKGALKSKASKNNHSNIETALVQTERTLNAVVSKSPLILF